MTEKELIQIARIHETQKHILETLREQGKSLKELTKDRVKQAEIVGSICARVDALARNDARQIDQIGDHAVDLAVAKNTANTALTWVQKWGPSLLIVAYIVLKEKPF